MSKGDAKVVLVIDDDRDLLDLVSFVLETEGYQVETAADGQEALDRLAQNLPDLILLDMKMPVMDGWEFAQQFHAQYDDQVPIVVLTAADNARRRANEVGAQGWIGKPFELDTLLKMVDEHIRQ